MKDVIKFRFMGIGIAIVMCAAFSAVVMLLWNALMPQIFALAQISYLQAAGLLVLARLLFGGMGANMRNYAAHHETHHGNMLRERWASMSEEERTAFFNRCGFKTHDPRFWDFMKDKIQTRRRPDTDAKREGGDE